MSFGQDPGWAPESIWRLWPREKSFVPTGKRTQFLERRGRGNVSILTEVPELPNFVESVILIKKYFRRSQWLWGLGHKMSECVRIPLYAQLSEFILCLRCPVQVADLRRADPSSKESYPLSIRSGI